MDWMSIATTFGFPCACVVAMGVAMWKIWEKLNVQSEKREERSYTMIAGFQASLEKFEKVLDKYNEKITSIDNKVDEVLEIVTKPGVK